MHLRSTTRRLLVLTLGYGVMLGGMLAAAPSQAQAQQHYLFSYFIGNGEDGLHLAHSTDGAQWTAIKGGKSLLTPTAGNDKLMRDPSIVRGPDGTFHMVWTVSWGERSIGYSSSQDLITWKPQQTVPVMEHEPTARNCWAPELLFDEPSGKFYIYWATTIPGRFDKTDGQLRRDDRDPGYDHRLYVVSTADFKEFTPAKLCYDHGFSVIDAAVVRTGGKYVMFLKDETDRPLTPQKNIRIATSDTPEGPFTEPTAPITGKYWAEGPTPLLVGDAWHVYFDKYTDHRYGMVTGADPPSSDPAAWTDESDRLVVPRGMRHGTAFAAPAEIVERLLELE